MARWTICSSSGGTPSTTWLIGLASVAQIAVRVESAESPENALRPVSISYITSPNEKMSDRGSTDFACACSGDM